MSVYGKNEEIYDLLSEMLQAAAKSAVMTVSSAVDRVVESALAAAAVANEAKKLVRIAEEEVHTIAMLCYVCVGYMMSALSVSDVMVGFCFQVSARAQREMEQEERDEQEQQDYCQEDLEMLQKVRTERAQQANESQQGEQQQKKVLQI